MPEPTPRLVATDLDGTLLRSDGSVSEHTRSVLEAVQRRDVPVVLVSGRPLRWMEHLWPVVGESGLAVAGNGAVVYDVAAREVHRLSGIEPAAGRDLVARLQDEVPGLELAVESVDGLRIVTGFAGARSEVVGEYETDWRAPATKVLARSPGRDFGELRDAVVAVVGSAATVTWSEHGTLEISADGVTKAAALAEVCVALGVEAQDVVAFGDMPNDVSMLRWAGRSFAVAGAHAEALDAADEVAPGHDEDGVARTLARVFGLDEQRGE